MKRFAILAVLALAACASEPETPVVVAQPADPAPAAVTAPAEPAPPPPVVALPAPDEYAAHHPAPATTVAKPDPRTLVYLASYKTEKAARAGFKALAKASPILAKQQPVVQTVDLGKKGTWVRLYGLAADEAERGRICGQVGKRVDECGARNRE